jgi:hypothetical protein
MRLLNFTLVTNPQAVELEIAGQLYDLHNQGDFHGVCFDAVNRLVELKWHYSGDRTSLETTTHKLALQVRNASFLAITPWDKAKPLSEANCLFGISRVVPQNDKVRFRDHWKPSDDFHLLFEFMSGQTIEVCGDEIVAQVAQTTF